jgi:hypothetical protein
MSEFCLRHVNLRCRREKLTPGSLMKAVIRSGSGDATPADGDQVRTSFLSSLQCSFAAECFDIS